MSAQQVFAEALLAAEPVCPPGLRAWNGSDPGRRFAVYRNNVMISLIDALADTFPVALELVGEEFFRAMAGVFVRAHPPRSPLLAFYGEDLPTFIESFPPAAGLPYLADVARLEMLRVRAYHAADSAGLAMAEMARLLADESALAATRFSLHASLGVLRSRHAVVSLWAAHQVEGAMPLAQVDPAVAEAALVLRVGVDVEISRLAPSAAEFIVGLQQGLGFAAAAEQAADFDLPATLGLLLRNGAITGVNIT
jgi:hypothetical protein